MKTQRMYIEDGVLDLREHYKVKKPKDTRANVQKEYISQGLRRLAISFQEVKDLKEKSIEEKKKIWEKERSAVDPRFRRSLTDKEMDHLSRAQSSDFMSMKDEKMPSIKKDTIERSIRPPKRVKFETTTNTERIDKPERPVKMDHINIPERQDNTERPNKTERSDKGIESGDKTDGRTNKTKRSDKRDDKTEKPYSTDKPENVIKTLAQNETPDKTEQPYVPQITVKPAVTNIPKMVERAERTVDQVESTGKTELIKTGVHDTTEQTEPTQTFGTVDNLIEKLYKTGINNTSEETMILQEVRDVVQSNGDGSMYDCEDFIYDYNIQYQPIMQYQSTYDPFDDNALLRTVDPRLRRKYSILNIPKTLSSNPGLGDRASEGNPGDIMNLDMCDDESVDSYYCRESQEDIHDAPYSHAVLISILVGFAVGVLAMSVLINLIYNSNILPMIFKLRQKREHSFAMYARYVGGGIIHIVTTFFQNLGRLLSIPTQHMYAPKPEYHRWPINPLNL